MLKKNLMLLFYPYNYMKYTSTKLLKINLAFSMKWREEIIW